jgi:hypothetical protein
MGLVSFMLTGRAYRDLDGDDEAQSPETGGQGVTRSGRSRPEWCGHPLRATGGFAPCSLSFKDVIARAVPLQKEETAHALPDQTR